MIKSEIRAGTHKKERSIRRREMDAQRSMHARRTLKKQNGGSRVFFVGFGFGR